MQRSLTLCPDDEDDDVHGLLVARQVDEQRGQPAVAAALDAHQDAEEQERIARAARHLPSQLEHGAAYELERPVRSRPGRRGGRGVPAALGRSRWRGTARRRRCGAPP